MPVQPEELKSVGSTDLIAGPAGGFRISTIITIAAIAAAPAAEGFPRTSARER